MKYKVTLNGKVYEVEVEKGEAILVDEYEAMAPAPAPAAAPVATPATPAPAAAPAAPAAAGANAVTSPLPGTVLEVKVSAGQAVKSGDLMFIIEAMKMENEVLAPRDGTVTKIIANKGSSVETGAALAELA